MQSPQTTPETKHQTEVLTTETSPEILVLENTAAQSSNFLAAAVVVTIIFLYFIWWRKWSKYRKKRVLLPEPPAEAEKIVCPTCGGSGKIIKKRRVSVPCGHCKKSGLDICHHCSGTGRDGLGYGVPLEDIENYPKCLHCQGKGSPEIPTVCCMCKGKRTEEYDEPFEEMCATCKGSGWIRNW